VSVRDLLREAGVVSAAVIAASDDRDLATWTAERAREHALLDTNTERAEKSGEYRALLFGRNTALDRRKPEDMPDDPRWTPMHVFERLEARNRRHEHHAPPPLDPARSAEIDALIRQRIAAKQA
jgi:hypothetical protein